MTWKIEEDSYTCGVCGGYFAGAHICQGKPVECVKFEPFGQTPVEKPVPVPSELERIVIALERIEKLLRDIEFYVRTK